MDDQPRDCASWGVLHWARRAGSRWRVLAWQLLGQRGQTGPAAGVGCSPRGELAYHVHAHLTIMMAGQPVTVPANIGVSPTCIAWMHTHDMRGLIHSEAPAPRTYTLGTFFQVWGQPLDATHLLDRTADAQHEIMAYVDGQRRAGPPETIPPTAHQVIVLEYGPPFVPPPPDTFPPGQ